MQPCGCILCRSTTALRQAKPWACKRPGVSRRLSQNSNGESAADFRLGRNCNDEETANRRRRRQHAGVWLHRPRSVGGAHASEGRQRSYRGGNCRIEDSQRRQKGIRRASRSRRATSASGAGGDQNGGGVRELTSLRLRGFRLEEGPPGGGGGGAVGGPGG